MGSAESGGRVLRRGFLWAADLETSEGDNSRAGVECGGGVVKEAGLFGGGGWNGSNCFVTCGWNG